MELGKYIPSTELAFQIAQLFGKQVEPLFTLEITD
nr:hypothetical protein [Adhaeribacter pallidiroseus]